MNKYSASVGWQKMKWDNARTWDMISWSEPHSATYLLWNSSLKTHGYALGKSERLHDSTTKIFLRNLLRKLGYHLNFSALCNFSVLRRRASIHTIAALSLTAFPDKSFSTFQFPQIQSAPPHSDCLTMNYELATVRWFNPNICSYLP